MEEREERQENACKGGREKAAECKEGGKSVDDKRERDNVRVKEKERVRRRETEGSRRVSEKQRKRQRAIEARRGREKERWHAQCGY